MGSYKTCQDREHSGGSSSTTDSDASDRSKSTALTALSHRRPSSTKHRDWIEVEYDEDDPRDSVSTYASTTASAAEIPPKKQRYEVVDRLLETFPTDALPSSPASFAALFPSSRRLLIRHDDATIDGNMNLRVDTVAPCRDGYQQNVILFHLRMYELFSRKFSFRRYYRDSGREVCHSARKAVSKTHDRRPVFRRSWSSMLASFRPGSSGQTISPAGEFKRWDSGFGTSTHDDSISTTDDAVDTGPRGEKVPALEDTILMEFSNYAHVELKRRGPALSKRYEYEYWSTKYQWRKESCKEGDLRKVSYYLVNGRTSRTIAHIVSDILTPMEAVEEESKGGWVPPSSLWISDSSVYERMPDVAE